MNGAVKWMAGNHVASNILMLMLVVGGIVIGSSVKQEVFPEAELDMVSITVAYPGASPTEVEDGILQPLERAVSSVDNVKRMISNAGESVGSLSAEVIDGADTDQVLSDIKSEVDRITTFPENSEEPVVSKITNKKEVITLIIYGDVSERAIYEQAERVRDDLLAKPNISQALLKAVRPLEISVEISEENLRRYNLTLNMVAGIIRRSSLDMPGGSIKTEGGEVLIRTNEKRYTGAEFDSVVVFTSPRGERVLLGDIATINDGFAEYDLEALFDGHRAAMVRVFRVGDQTPKGVSTAVKEYIDYISPQLPPSIKVAIWTDSSVILDQRIDLLMRNGRLGFILVLIILALFLEIRLALWVALGAMISFVGAIAFMPVLDASINMLSLFAFLIVLGVVVDDAIIVGENIHVHRKRGKPFFKAAVDGTTEVIRPVVFAVLTTIAAFSPLLFASGMMGKMMSVIPQIVITVLLISLVESMFILPAHLSSGLIKSQARIWVVIENQRQKFDRLVRWMIDSVYAGTLKWVVHYRYTTIAISLALLLGAVGLVTGGYVKFVFSPRIDADVISVSLTMAPGTTFDQTKEVAEYIQDEGMKLVSEYDEERGDGESELLHAFATVGTQAAAGMSTPMSKRSPSGSNLAIVSMLFVDGDTRTMKLQEFSRQWRDRLGPIPGVEKLSFKAVLMQAGEDIDIQLAHEDYGVLVEAVERVKDALAGYGGVEEINDSYIEGKRELKLRLKPEASSLGITETDLALQVRGAFYGAEALRLQRGRNEVKVMVRYPEEARRMMASIENMRIRTPMGGEVPFSQAAYVDDSQGYSSIKR
ncbi:MAG: efflux RND transporter permease subunit, partial [Candidatus Electryoneaceae bacterium]|nr:efflux RND transporter permease subunit [Candidatus Electryoneaceae bacterium]